MTKKIDLKKDYIQQINEAIEKQEDIVIEVKGEDRNGMSQLALSLGMYYKNLTKHSSKKDAEWIKYHGDEMQRLERGKDAEIKGLRKTIGQYQREKNRLKIICTKLHNTIRIRLHQIRNMEGLTAELKKEGKVTIQQLKTHLLTKRQVKEQLGVK